MADTQCQDDEEITAWLREAREPSTPNARLLDIYQRLGGTELWWDIRHGVPPSGAYQGIPRTEHAWQQVYETLAALAEHPNVSPQMLCALAPAVPEAVLRNPLLPMLALEDSGFAARLVRASRRSLLRCPHFPAALLPLLVGPNNYWEIAEEAPLHIAYAGELTGDWRQAISDYWREWLEREAVPPPGTTKQLRQWHNRRRAQIEFRVELVELGLAPAWSAGPQPWPEPHVPVPSVPPIGKRRKGVAESVKAASDPAADPESLRNYVHDPAWEVRLALARNPATPASLLGGVLQNRFRDSSISLVQQAVALHPNATTSELRLVVSGCQPSLRRAVLRHMHAGEDLVSVCRDTAREEAIQAHNLPFERFCGLAAEGGFAPESLPAQILNSEWWERLAAAVSSALAVESDILRELSNDGNRLVRAAARGRLRGEAFTWM